MKRFVIKTITGETMYVHAQHFVVDEHDMINFLIYPNNSYGSSLVASCVKKNVVLIYIEEPTNAGPDDGEVANNE